MTVSGLAPAGCRPNRCGWALLLAVAATGCERRESSDGVVSARPGADAVASIAKRAPSSAGELRRGGPAELIWDYPDTPIGKMRVVVVVPEHAGKERLPVLVALHGRGEALKGPERGARAWIDDYGLYRALSRLKAAPLTARDFEGWVEPARLGSINRSLAERAYRGLILVLPYTPDMLKGDPFDAAPPLAAFLVDELLPRVRRETPSSTEARATGIDGVSLGGRAAFAVGLLRPSAFGAVGGLQPAFDVRDAGEIARRARLAKADNLSLELRLLTSDDDYFRAPTRAISRAFDAAGVSHRLLEVRGPHDYGFNRGPGVFEMLLYFDRVLRGEEPP